MIQRCTILETLIAVFFKIARLIKEIRLALAQREYEGAFQKSQKIQKMLMVLEGEFSQLEYPEFAVLVHFFQVSSRALKEVLLKSDMELAELMEKTFKNLGMQYQDTLEKQENHKGQAKK